MDDRQKATAIALAGLVLIGMNFLALAPFVAGQVKTGVADTIADGYDETLFDEDWQMSTAERVYFGYTITNVADFPTDTLGDATCETH